MNNHKKELLSGVFYTSIAKYSNIVVQLVVTAILARLLTPTDYGVVAVATVFIAFFNLLSDIGIGPAIIQFKNLTKHDLNQIFSFTVYVGIVLSIIFILLSWGIAEYYHNPVLVPVCQLLSFTILFYCINIVPQNLLYKRKRFKFVAFVTLFMHIITALLAIFLALMRFGVYSLVVQQITSVFFIFVVFYFQDKLRFEYKIDVIPLKKITSFSIYQFLFNVINYFSRNLDKLLIGRYIGLAPLGQYEKSYKLMMMPLQNISHAVTPVMQPIFSDYQNNLSEMAFKYKQIFVLLCYIGFPLSLLLFFSGRELILLFFGSQWEEAIMPFRILALSVGLQMLNGTTGSIYQSANATKQLFISGCWCAFFMISGFVISIWGWGTINAVSIGFVVAQIFNSAQTYYLLFKTLKYPITDILISMIYPTIVSLLVGGLLFFIYPECNELPLLWSLIVKCVVSFVVCCLLYEIYGAYMGFIRNAVIKICKK